MTDKLPTLATLHDVADILRGAEMLSDSGDLADACRAATLIRLARDQVRALAAATDLAR